MVIDIHSFIKFQNGNRYYLRPIGISKNEIINCIQDPEHCKINFPTSLTYVF
jgi:hypothetical protein